MLNWRYVLLGVGIIIALVAFLWLVPQLHSYQNVPPEEMSALENEVRRTWAQIIGGIVLLLGLYATWRRVEIAERTLEATQDQQVTERFTRAIDQLGATDDKGHPRLEIRLGGIYALERIARDSPERDYSTVMEVLTAYVRENASWSPEGSSVSNSASDEAAEQEKAERGAEPTPQHLRADIQAILDVLGRREEDRVPEKHRVRLYLPGTNLQGAHIPRARFEKVVLIRSHLEGAFLAGAHLEGAWLVSAHLEKVTFLRVHLKGAVLRRAHLEGADLSKAIGLTQKQIDSANGDEKTHLPEGLVRPAHWSKSTDEQQNGEE